MHFSVKMMMCGAAVALAGSAVAQLTPPGTITAPKAGTVPPTISPTLLGPAVDATITVNGQGAVDFGTIKCATGAGQSSKLCSRQVAKDKLFELKATPAAGMQFVGWAGACSGSAPICQLTPTKAVTVAATFVPVPSGEQTLTLQAEVTRMADLTVDLSPKFQFTCSPQGWPGGSQTAWIRTCHATVPTGTKLVLSGTWYYGMTGLAHTDVTPKSWNNGCDSTAGNTCTITMDKDRALIVNQPK